MTGRVEGPPAVRALYRVLDGLVPQVSAARARQLRWVVGELALAVGREEMPRTAGQHLRVLLGRRSLDTYVELAASGVLRRNRVDWPERASDASVQVRRQCLKLLGEAAGVAVRVPVAPPIVLRETVPEGQQRAMFRRLASMAAAAPGDALRARLLAVVGVVLDTGARLGELAAMTTDDLGDEVESVRVVRRQQGRRVAPIVTEHVELSGPARVAVGHWLRARAELVDALDGGPVRALWVTVQATHLQLEDGRSVPRPAGLPLMPRGLARSYTAGVRALNGQMMGEPGWSPLPTRLEALRRAVDLEDAEVAG